MSAACKLNLRSPLTRPGCTSRNRHAWLWTPQSRTLCSRPQGCSTGSIGANESPQHGFAVQQLAGKRPTSPQGMKQSVL